TQAGDVQPFYNYKIIHHIQSSDELGIAHKNSVLQLSNDYQGLSELGMLALRSEYHGLHLGTFLSRVRFLYLADKPARVSPKIIAQMRGVIDDEGLSVFWQAVGQKFIDLSFIEVDRRIAQGQGHFVAELLPDTPIAVSLLPGSVQAVIGKTHPKTFPDFALLMREGFTFENYINIFEGGPCLELYLKENRTLRNSHEVRVAAIVPVIAGPTYMIATVGEKFRACLGEVMVQNEADITLTKQSAQLLNVHIGDTVRISL
ncbi:MAG TPA: arginine N-succinyltransferase, partial [Gammaproteobacteria bacterium]|nr:arginine N-succinyltransferase [Gammaproteobacteria bacterium]